MSVPCEGCVLSGRNLLQWADPSSRGDMPSAVCVCVTECDQVQGPSTPTMSRYKEVTLRKREKRKDYLGMLLVVRDARCQTTR